MFINKAFRLVVLAVVFLLTKDCFASGGCKTQPLLPLNADTINIYFRFADALVLSDYKSNKDAFARFNRIICSHQNSLSAIDSILVCGYASPDGFIDNNKLSKKRALATKSCILWMYPGLNNIPINTAYKVMSWSDIACLVQDDVHIPNRVKALSILRSCKKDETIEANLKKLNGNVYSYLQRNILPKCQVGISCIVYSKCLKKPITSVDLSNKVEQSEVDTPIVDTLNNVPSCAYLETTKATTLVDKPKKHPILALKNNLLYDAILLPNIELELYIARRLSVNLDFQCAWWHFKESDRFYQVMSLSPEFRFWLRPDSRFNGHFFGLYVGGGYYDLKWGETGYQGEFYIAAGISYGFYLPIKPNFGIEFNLGVGFLSTKYEKYARYEHMDSHYIFGGKDKLTYFGPTKAKISLVWRLGDKAKKGRGK